MNENKCANCFGISDINSYKCLLISIAQLFKLNEHKQKLKIVESSVHKDAQSPSISTMYILLEYKTIPKSKL